MAMMTFVLTHGDAFVTVLLSILAIVKLTAWGRANAQALQLVVDAIEATKQSEVKKEVAQWHADLPEIAQDALTHAVQTVDANKTPLPPALRVCRELLRGLFPVR